MRGQSRKEEEPKKARTQKELARDLADKYGITENKARNLIHTLLVWVGEDLLKFGHVELRGLGTFETVPRPAQTIKHPVTKQPIQVPAYHAIRFRASKKLREELLPDQVILKPKKRRR